ncbi:hypothetical protein [Roseateles noduli]|jgi:hypothetical protein|uniref:hypothetical protein n=1 Tax=Roseateles noduli TaxID=2052484 RepID=UPI003D65287A
MEVLDHEPQLWFLVGEKDSLLFEVTCSHGAVDYIVTLALNDAERQAYAARGHAYLNELAEAIHFSAPGVRGSVSPYRDRKLDSLRSNRVSEAVRDWLKRPEHL